MNFFLSYGEKSPYTKKYYTQRACKEPLLVCCCCCSAPLCCCMCVAVAYMLLSLLHSPLLCSHQANMLCTKTTHTAPCVCFSFLSFSVQFSCVITFHRAQHIYIYELTARMAFDCIRTRNCAFRIQTKQICVLKRRSFHSIVE